MRDPLARLPTPARLWAAAVLCIVPLGLVWSRSSTYVTSGYAGSGTCDADGYCSPGIVTPGIVIPGHVTQVSQSPARVFLVAAAALLVLVAVRVRIAQTRRLVRLAAGLLVVTGSLAAAQRATPTLVCVVAALLLAAPPAWSGRRPGAVLAPGGVRR